MTPYAVPPRPVPPRPPARPHVEGSGERALLLTRDRALIERLERLATAAGADLEVSGTVPDESRWLAAVLVLVGDDLADAVAAAMPRRRQVFLVSAGLVSPGLMPDPTAPLVADQDRDLDRDRFGDHVGAEDGALWRRGLEVGAERVVLLPQGQDWLVDALADSFDGEHRCAALAVVGGCGGAGASMLAAGVAVTSALQGRRTLLVDLDPLGGGIDVLLGAERVSGLRWPDLASARGRLTGGMLREALPRLDGLSLLSWDRADPVELPPSASVAVAAGARRGFDVVVLDLPRQVSTVAPPWLRMADLGLVVLPPGVRALAAAARVIPALGRAVDDLRVVVRGPSSSSLPADIAADALGLPLLGELRAEPGLVAALDRGEPPALRPRGPLARLSGRVLDALPRVESAA